jgi:aspartyl-tRNA(Asn)/glutamyl-tRNA(Gln) amidotransferase subunit C
MSDAPVRGLSRADVVHVAGLARLALTDAEIDQYTADLAGILGHAEDVASLDTTGIAPTAHPLPLANVFRADVIRPSLDRDEVLAAAPSAADAQFSVPSILGVA